MAQPNAYAPWCSLRSLRSVGYLAWGQGSCAANARTLGLGRCSLLSCGDLKLREPGIDLEELHDLGETLADEGVELVRETAWTKASSIRVVLIGLGVRCRVASAGLSDVKRT